MAYNRIEVHLLMMYQHYILFIFEKLLIIHVVFIFKSLFLFTVRT